MSDSLTPARDGGLHKGLWLAGTGGCLMWTVVLIPIALPMAIIGIIMAIWSQFTPVEFLTCPACGQTHPVEPDLGAGLCPSCHVPIKRTEGGWTRV